jgi:predicted O-methyltransferase YrrM
MGERICPWWLGYILASPIRRLFQDPAATVEPYVRRGMTVLEPGPGMGFFTVELARHVSPNGRVIAVDVQPRMIAGLKKRIARAGLSDRVDARVAPPDSLGLADLKGQVDFALAMAVVHETPGAGWFFNQVADAMKPGGIVLVAEPAGHVKEAAFAAEIEAAAAAGFQVTDRPTMRRLQTAVLKKKAAGDA